MVTNFIKDEVEGSFDAEFTLMIMTLKKESLDLDKTHVTGNKILVVCNGASLGVL